MITIKVVGDSNGWKASQVCFDPTVKLNAADGLLCWGLPDNEFYKYKGVKAWYLSEPLYFSARRFFQIRASQILSRGGDFLHFSRRDSKVHVPMITHYSPLTISNVTWEQKRNSCIALVSNHGGKGWWLSRSHTLRNKFITNPRVDLFGSLAAWQRFQKTPFSAPSIPSNYKGEWPSHFQWHHPQHIEALARHRYIIALENSCEQNYLSEKLINAFRAGSIPIYWAHSSVRKHLEGAKWIDPSDYNFDVDKTLDAAIAADHRDFQIANERWLKSIRCSKSDGYNVWATIGKYFIKRLKGQRHSL